MAGIFNNQPAGSTPQEWRPRGLLAEWDPADRADFKAGVRGLQSDLAGMGGGMPPQGASVGPMGGSMGQPAGFLTPEQRATRSGFRRFERDPAFAAYLQNLGINPTGQWHDPGQTNLNPIWKDFHSQQQEAKKMADHQRRAEQQAAKDAYRHSPEAAAARTARRQALMPADIFQG